MEGERHLLSNHEDIETTRNNAIEHFLYVEFFREEQKICWHANSRLTSGRHFSPSEATTGNTSAVSRLEICLNLLRRGQDVSAIFPTGSGRPSFFLLFPRIINVIKGKVGESISTIIIVAPLVAIMKPTSSDLE